MNAIKVLLASVFFCFLGTGSAYTVQPVDGLWGVVDEISLAVGRAINLEVSDNLLVVTMYAYNRAGAPTFYVGGAVLDSTNKAAVTLSEPQGGTCLGCAPTSGRLLSTPGVAVFEFTNSISGFVTLPGEARKAIVKGAIAWPAAPSGLLGLWVFNYIPIAATSVFSDVILLDRTVAGTSTGSGLVVDSPMTTGCEYQVSGAAAGVVLCVHLLSSGAVDRTVRIKWYGNLMDGFWNYNGLTTFNVFTARRLYSASGNQTDIKRKAEPVDTTERENALRDAIARASLEAK